MELTVEQINIISKSIEINDIINYINTHLLEYQEFLDNLKNEQPI